MQIIQTDSYEYEISEKNIIIKGNKDKYVLQILVARNLDSSTLYICSDVENGNIMEIEIDLNDVVVFSKENSIICKEKGNRPGRNTSEINLNIDHSKTINTITDKIGNTWSRIAFIFKRVFLIGIIVSAIVLGISYSLYLNEESNYLYGKWKLIGVSNNSKYEQVGFLAYFEINKDSNVYWRVDTNSNKSIDPDEILNYSYTKIGKDILQINNKKWKYKATSYQLDLENVDASGNITVQKWSRVGD